MRICSQPSSAENEANVAAYVTNPHEASPAATVIMFFSAIPRLKKRSGWRAAKSFVRLALARSAVSTAMRSSWSARSASSSPRTNAGAARCWSLPSVERSSRRLVRPDAVPRKTSLVSCDVTGFAVADRSLDRSAAHRGHRVAVSSRITSS